MRDIRLQPPALAVLTGKGRKTRHVPLGGNTAALLGAYLAEHGLDKPGHDDHPLFVSQHRRKLTRGGIAWIIRKYQAQPATRRSPARPEPSRATPLCGRLGYVAGGGVPAGRGAVGAGSGHITPGGARSAS